MTFLSRRIATSAAAATLLAALSVPTLAQTPPPGPQARSEQMQEMRKERMESWAVKFKQQLQLTPAQEGAWSTYMEAMKPREHARLGTDWKDLRALPTPERIDRLRALREQHAADADRRGEATKAFYGQLTPAQQKTRLCHKSVLMTGTPMASSKSWRGFAAPPVRSKNRNHAR